MGLTNKNCEESEIDLMPDGWKTERLGQLVRKFVNGGTPTTLKKEYWTGNIPWISGADVVGQKVNIIRRFITKDAVENSSTNIIQKGNLLVVSRTGVGKFAIAPFDVAISQDLTGIYTDESTLLPEYLFRYLDFKQKALHTQNQGTSIQGITRETLSEIRISLPDTSEQIAIATALSDTDALIENLERLIAKKRNIKQGVMQELLTGKKRLAGFNGEWAKIELGDICDIRKGQLITEKTAAGGEFPVIAGGINPSYFHNRPNRGKNTITISASGANAGYVSFHRNPIFASDCSTIEEKGTFNIVYLFFVLQLFQKKIFKLQTGGAQPHVYPEHLKPLELLFPQEVTEQYAIANILIDIDEELSGLEKQMNKYQLIKQGMMQTLLTGKIRLV